MSSRGVNKAIIIGFLGNDPDLRFAPGGDAICNISVATSETWKDKNTGETKEVTEWHRICAFGKLAEIMGQYLEKGSRVYIEGSLRTRTYEKDGHKRYATEIRADSMQMLDSKERDDAGRDKPSQSEQSRKPATPSTDDHGFDDDIPF